MVLTTMTLLRSAPNASVAHVANATHLQDAMVTSAASVLYVLLLLPALARNQSIGFAPPASYVPYAQAAPALNTGYPAFGFPAYGGGYPSYGGVAPVYAPAGSLPAAPPFSGYSGGVGAVGSPGVGGGSPLGFSGYGFPAGWPARPLGPVAAALATAYPNLFAALAGPLSGPCRSWCRAPTLPFLFPPSAAETATAAEQPLQALLGDRDRDRDRPVLRFLRAMLRGRDGGDSEEDKERGPLMRLLFPEE